MEEIAIGTKLKISDPANPENFTEVTIVEEANAYLVSPDEDLENLMIVTEIEGQYWVCAPSEYEVKPIN